MPISGFCSASLMPILISLESIMPTATCNASALYFVFTYGKVPDLAIVLKCM